MRYDFHAYVRNVEWVSREKFLEIVEECCLEAFCSLVRSVLILPFLLDFSISSSTSDDLDFSSHGSTFVSMARLGLLFILFLVIP